MLHDILLALYLFGIFFRKRFAQCAYLFQKYAGDIFVKRQLNDDIERQKRAIIKIEPAYELIFRYFYQFCYSLYIGFHKGRAIFQNISFDEKGKP